MPLERRDDMASGPNHPFRRPLGLSIAEKSQLGRKNALALGKPTGGPSKATRARIQEALEQEARTRRNIETLNYEGETT
jgi:hypothetical protein